MIINIINSQLKSNVLFDFFQSPFRRDVSSDNLESAPQADSNNKLLIFKKARRFFGDGWHRKARVDARGLVERSDGLYVGLPDGMVIITTYERSLHSRRRAHGF